MSEDSLFASEKPDKPDDGKPLHRGWLLKNPICERASADAKWKVPAGRPKRRWFVLSKSVDTKQPCLQYYTDDKETTLKGTLELAPSWNVQRAKNARDDKNLFELFSD